MIYKFNTGDNKNTNTYLEFRAEGNQLFVIAGDYDEGIIGTLHYLEKSEIDEMIIALSNIKNEITEYERNNF